MPQHQRGVQRQPSNPMTTIQSNVRAFTDFHGATLIGLPIPDENGNETFQYFTDEDAAEAAVRPFIGDGARALAGAWSDLDWDEMERDLDRIRHQSVPTPPIEEQ